MVKNICKNFAKNICKNFLKNILKNFTKNFTKNAAQVLDDLTTPTRRYVIFAPPPPHSATLSSKFKTTQHCYTHPRNTVGMVTHLLCISYKFNTVVTCILRYVALYVGMRYAYITHCNINQGDIMDLLIYAGLFNIIAAITFVAYSEVRNERV